MAAIAAGIHARADRGLPLVVFAVVVACGVHAIALVRGSTPAFAVVVGILAVTAVASVEATEPGQIALVGGALLLATELATWSAERRTAMTAAAGVDTRRWLLIIVLVPTSVAAALALLVVADALAVGGGVLPFAGVLGALGVTAVVVVTVRRGDVS